MNRDDIIRMAHEAGVIPPGWGATEMQWRSLDAFAALVAAVEREACANAAGPEDSYRDEWFNAKADSVKRIRARGSV